MQLFKKVFYVTVVSLFALVLIPRNVDAFSDYTFFNINVNDNTHFVNANDQGSHIFTDGSITGGFTIVYDGSGFESSRVATPFLTLERRLPNGSFETIFDGEFIRDGEITEMEIPYTGFFRMIGNTLFWGNQTEPAMWMDTPVTFEITDDSLFSGWVVTVAGVEHRLDNYRNPEDPGWHWHVFNGNDRFFYITYIGFETSANFMLLQFGDRQYDGAPREGVIGEWGGVLLPGVPQRINFEFSRVPGANSGSFTLRGTGIDPIGPNGGINFSIRSITRVRLTPDPMYALAGTEVTMNGGYRERATITQGFTRILYIGDRGAFQSRSNFILTSSNPEVATISEHGTIFARSPGFTNIRAMRRDNQQIGEITIQVLADTSQVPRNIGLTTDLRPGGIPGTEVTSGLGVAGGRTLHVGFTRHISFTGPVPSPLIQDYTWVSRDSSIATVSQFGTVTAIREGRVTIDVFLTANNRFTGSINLEVISSWFVHDAYGQRIRLDGNTTSPVTIVADSLALEFIGVNSVFGLFQGNTVIAPNQQVNNSGIRRFHNVGGLINFRSGNTDIVIDLQRSIESRLTHNAELGSKDPIENRGRPLNFSVTNDYPGISQGVLIEWLVDGIDFVSSFNNLTITIPMSMSYSIHEIRITDLWSGQTTTLWLNWW